jgi:alpha-tubulin suppressor-like RCC1 family protein
MSYQNNIKSSGLNDSGQLGDGSNENSKTPVSVVNSGVLAFKNIKSISTPCGYNVFVVASDNKLYGWGQNADGALGIGNNNPSNVPVAVGGMVSFRTMAGVASTGDYALAFDTSGKIYAWGSNSFGQLGDGTTVNKSSPVMLGGILGSKRIIAVSSSLHSSFALDSTGKVYCWGLNDMGQLGNTNTESSAFPGLVYAKGVLSGKIVRAISSGAQFTVALDSAGVLYAWGKGTEGQLGNGTNLSSTVPVKVKMDGVLAGKSVVEISAGSVSVLARTVDGKLYSWGSNFYGTLGNSTTDPAGSNVPVEVTMNQALNGLTAKSITSSFTDGDNCFCMIKASDNKFYGWGTDYYGAFGSGGPTIASAPVPIFPGLAGISQVATAAGAGFALLT